MAAGEYVSVSTQSDSEQALLDKERRELRDEPEEELEELAGLYVDKGLTEDLALEVAKQLTEHDALGAHAEAELGIDPDDISSPWNAAFASMVAFTVGALLPLLTITLLGPTLRVWVTVVSVTARARAHRMGERAVRLRPARPGRRTQHRRRAVRDVRSPTRSEMRWGRTSSCPRLDGDAPLRCSCPAAGGARAPRRVPRRTPRRRRPPLGPGRPGARDARLPRAGPGDEGSRTWPNGSAGPPPGVRRSRPPFSGGGAFPHAARAKVLWAGLDLDEPARTELDRLATGCRAAANRAGVAVDGARFRPHLTVGRTKHPHDVSNWVRLLDSYSGPRWEATELTLVQSHLGEGPRGRPRHVPLDTFRPRPRPESVGSGRVNIAVARETREGETRVALVPELVGKLTGLGYDVAVEPDAGRHALLSDEEYAEAGATLDADALSSADVVVSVQPLDRDGIRRLKRGARPSPSCRSTRSSHS